eukprot:118731-Prymnesium_polylepis.1
MRATVALPHMSATPRSERTPTNTAARAIAHAGAPKERRKKAARHVGCNRAFPLGLAHTTHAPLPPVGPEESRPNLGISSAARTIAIDRV